MKLIKQTVYIPVKVNDELPKVDSICFRNGKKLLFTWSKEKDIQDLNITHWLKPQEGYFFTPQELNQLLSDVIKDAPNTASEKVTSKLKENCT